MIVIEPGAVATELTDHITDAETKRLTKEFVRGPRDHRRGHRRGHRVRRLAAAADDAQRDSRPADGPGLTELGLVWPFRAAILTAWHRD